MTVRNDDIRSRTSKRGAGKVTEVIWPRKEARPLLRRKNDSGDGTTWEKKNMKTESEMDGLCQPITVSTDTWEPSERQKMKSMPALAGEELYLPQQRPHNQVGAARRRRQINITITTIIMNLLHIQRKLQVWGITRSSYVDQSVHGVKCQPRDYLYTKYRVVGYSKEAHMVSAVKHWSTIRKHNEYACFLQGRSKSLGIVPKQWRWTC